MILPDVNLLIYAYRRDVPLHRVSRSWLDSTIESEARFAISKLTLSAFVRITTNSRAYRIPTSLTDAFAFCDNLLGQPHCEVIEPGEGHWDIFRRL